MQSGEHIGCQLTTQRPIELTERLRALSRRKLLHDQAADMVVPEKYPIKDVDGLPDGVHFTFEKKLKPELICCTCDAVTPKGLKDGKGHIYCQACVAAHTDRFNKFTCSLSGCQANKMDMSSNDKEWDILKNMKAACPNEDKPCRFKGALQDVLGHYKACGHQGKVPCSFCNCLHDRKTLASHMSDDCPRRLLECCFCRIDVIACEKLNHESSCRQRPARCQHCRKNFKTVSELEDNHYYQCPQFPVNCAFKALGCSFYAARHEVILHEEQVKHTEILVQEVCRMKEENKMLRENLQQQGTKYEKNVKHLSDLVAKLHEEIRDVQQCRVELEEKVKKQQQQLDAQNRNNGEEKLAVKAFMAATEEAVGFLKRELYLGPQQSVFEHVWKLYPYSNLKRAAATPRNGPLSSGVLSINKPGYSIELVADVCRPVVGKATSPHLALKMRIHKGDYDDLLPWPFTNKIRLVLVNQLDEAKSVRFELDPSTAPNAAECLKKPAQDQLNPMFGYSQLISIPLLENERKGFLLRNCVVLKFSVLALE